MNEKDELYDDFVNIVVGIVCIGVPSLIVWIVGIEVLGCIIAGLTGLIFLIGMAFCIGKKVREVWKEEVKEYEEFNRKSN